MNYINKLNKTYKLFKGINLFRYRFILKKEKTQNHITSITTTGRINKEAATLDVIGYLELHKVLFC